MKKCPECGAMLNVDVNFCTNCGADVRQVLQVEVNRSDIQTEIKRIQENADNQDSSDQLQQYWQWLVISWQHPFKEQVSVSWYGLVTLLIEDFLLALGLYIGTSNISNQYINGQQLPVFTGISLGTTFEIFFFVLLFEAAFAGTIYLVYLFIYGQRRSFISVFNHALQASNLNIILMLAAFIFMMLGIGGKVFAIMLCAVCFNIFVGAFVVVLLGDPNPVRDKMYGFMIAVVASFIVSAIWGTIVYNTIVLQVLSYFGRL
ncbi:zinc ribbon domain-containing protein [Lactobacillus sp. ESL0785]|uniref:DUF6574 domain-containing protein n=1 Tax=Lactobacillus sp. ESL0785 TaxID=2983232 RepID=UPI0023F7A342|nr:DUF6574 domain-containing protein [Lactobacillus sp. ESL0785]WEV71015.1 zinc ribbon domain-containing protein [Lactobacillus sp. ESL0785]